MFVARKRNWLARPRADRWHQRPTALFGGVALYITFVAGALLFVPLSREVGGLLLGTTAVFALGLADDIRSIRPYTKLIGQIAAACILVMSGVHIEFVIHPLLAIPLTIIWVVGITNAFNLLDNMDGLSSGVAVIAAIFLFLFTREADTTVVAGLSLVLAGAAVGFLLFNFNPARIFMGDCGSMTLGFALSAVAVMGTYQQAGNLFLILAVPVLILAVPIFDTTLVTVLRKLSGRAVSEGGRDHSSHRLVALGLTERRAVLVLWGLCAAFGAIALVGFKMNLFAAAVTAALLLVGIFFFGVFLGQVPIYRVVTSLPDGAEARRPALINTLLLHKRRIVEVGVDFVLICAAYVSAYLLRFEGEISPQNLRLIYQSLPILIVIKMSALTVFGLYRGVWRYVGITDALNIVKAVVAGSLVSALALVLLYRFEGFSRSVLILDGLLLMFMLAGVRALLRVFRETFSTPARAGKHVLIVGAGDAGEMLLREMRSDVALAYRPIGFLDDDREKHGRNLHGVPVLGGISDLSRVCKRHGVEEVLIAIPRATGAEMSLIVEACAAVDVPFRTAPRLSELIDGHVTLGMVREINVSDLLGRAPIPSDSERLRKAVAGKTVLITGAAGTVGAEVATRALAHGAAHVVLVDSDDNKLADLADPGRLDLARTTLVLQNVADAAAMKALIAKHRPMLVVHAAGVNQVSLLEQSVAGAVAGNVLTTLSVVKACLPESTLVLVSTTKAFRPSSAAAATRRIAEQVARALTPPTMTVRVVRLPNILGAKGGVLERFKRQLAASMPLTVTDEGASRHFVTRSEAASLVLESGTADATREHVLVPRGTEPIAIVEIARALGRVNGQSDVPMTITGLRPGEPLEDARPQDVHGVDHPHLAGAVTPVADPDALAAQIDNLCATTDDDALRELLSLEALEPGARILEFKKS